MASISGIMGITLLLLLGSLLPVTQATAQPGPGLPAHEDSVAAQVLESARTSLGEGKGPAAGHALTCTPIGTLSLGCAGSPTASRPSGGNLGWERLCAFDACPPPARGGVGMTYDPATGYIVLFGGINNLTIAPGSTYSDTWIFEKGNWSKLNITGPSPRLGQYMAYDYADGYVVLFGGGPYLTLNSSLYYDDTWTFQNGTWTQLHLSTHPNARGLGGMTWDALDGYLLMYGGMTSQTDIHSDTWTFSGGLWHNLSLAYHPPPLLAPVLCYDPAEHYTLLFGGATPSPNVEFGLDLEQTWEYAHGTWTNLTGSIQGTVPYGRILSSMAYDPVQGFLVLYGGWNTTTGALFGDTWIYADGTWSIYFVSPSPASAIIGESLISTVPTAGLFFFGGIVGNYNSYRATNATWAFGPPPANSTVGGGGPSSPYSVSFGLAPSKCKVIVFNGSLETTDSSDTVLPGQYIATAPNCPGYSFGGWFGSGGVNLASPDTESATFYVTGNGTLTAYYQPQASQVYQANAPELLVAAAGIAAVVVVAVVAYRRSPKTRGPALIR